MKTVLGCLMCLVFTMSQSFAISGGPFGGGAGKPSTTGTYAPMFTAVTFAAVAAGKVDAKVKNKKGSTSVRLTGTADVQFELTVNNPFDEVIFNVVGFKQSNS